jgi:hypothetical protein
MDFLIDKNIVRCYGDALAVVHVQREQEAHHPSVLNLGAVAVSRSGQIAGGGSTTQTTDQERQLHRHRLLAREKIFDRIRPITSEVKAVLHSRTIALILLLLMLALSPPASAYGKSVEDLVGSFSIGKTIKIGSSSECFSSAGEVDPLTPPRIGAAGPLSDDQAPSLAGFTLEPQQLSLASLQPVNLTAHLIDDQAVWAAEAAFSGPSGGQAIALFNSQNRNSGTAKDGSYAARMMLPANETGEWHLQNLTMVDLEGNRKILVEDDLASLGLHTVIAVV